MRHPAVLLSTLLAVACHHESGPGGDGGVGDMDVTPSLDAACAVGGAKATLKRLNLVVLYDRSGSMGDGMPGDDPAVKWIPVGAGMKGFFEDPDSAGVNASLSYFPYKQNDLEQCNSSAYFFPDVKLTSLPSTAFAMDIASTTPAGQTPTLPAMQGGIAAAQMIAMSDSTAQVAIVLVTDGEPDICSSSVHNVAQAAMMVATTIPTYVIGVGLSQAALAEISMAGGTGMPVIASVGNAAQTTQDIQSAFTNIRFQQVPCTFPLPPPPNGKVLDVDKVNVLYTPSSGMQTALTYDTTCPGGQGWRYDDATNPTQVILCPLTCKTIQADKGAAVDILFGCQTRGDVR
jgi:hypothetical protein